MNGCLDSIGREDEWEGLDYLMMRCIRKMFPQYFIREQKAAAFSQLFLQQKIIEALQHPETGVAIRTVNSFINKIPSVFTGLPTSYQNLSRQALQAGGCAIDLLIISVIY